jgi:putative membrane-bound dehydrogenase-like protein
LLNAELAERFAFGFSFRIHHAAFQSAIIPSFERAMHFNPRFALVIGILAGTVALGRASLELRHTDQARSGTTTPRGLTARQDPRAGTISVFRTGNRQPILTQNAGPGTRPNIHPIAAPDGRTVLTDPAGLFWGFTNLNGRDFFHNTQAAFWRRQSATITQASGEQVGWETVYDLLDASGTPLLTETARWTMREAKGRYVLSLEWRGQARTDVTIGSAAAGQSGTAENAGVFLQLWRGGRTGDIVNAARQRNDRAAGQRAMWIDVAAPGANAAAAAHVAIFDYPDNAGYPQTWQVDRQSGVGALRAPGGAWTIKKGNTEIVRYQFLIYNGALNDVAMDAAWAEYTGNRSAYATSALWTVAQREGRQAKFLTADEAVAEMSLVDGYRVNAWAAEPMIVQPMAFCWDDRGRLWVAENRDYESRVQGFSAAGNSRIVILEDTNHDGIADTRKVFMDGIVFPSALAVGFGGVFVAAPPNLLFIPDRDGDDKADVANIEVRLTGWGIRDRHEVVNSLHWGPDGWLYGLQGYATSSKVRKPEGKGRLYNRDEPFPEDVLSGDGVEINGGVWRYHPTKDVFEVVAHGFSNPWGIDYDAKGQLFITACVIPHLFHVIPGGIYQRQGGQHFNPYVYSDIQTIADHRHRSAHGGARIYQSDAFPSSQQGRIFMANIHEHAVLSDVLERQGSGFIAHHGDDFLLANNAQWIGFSMEVGPDGAVYVLDWHDSDICGMEVRQKETGRIFRIAPQHSLAEDWPGRYGDLSKLTDAELVGLQTSRSDWHARRARTILQARAATGSLKPEASAELHRLFQSSANPDHRLRAMWALHVTHGWTPDALVVALNDRDEYVRAWAIQLLCEDRSPPDSAMQRFSQLARDDRSPVVRLYLASALQRLSTDVRWTVATGLMTHAEDVADQNLSRMIWFGVEPLVAANPGFALERAASSRIPILARFIARRTVDADAIDASVRALARAPATERDMLEGIRDGLDGRYDVAAPTEWPIVYARLRRGDAALARLASDVNQKFNDADATIGQIQMVRDPAAPVDERRKALQTLTLQRRPQLAPILPSLIDDPALRLDAIRSAASFDDESLGKLLISRYQTFTAAEKTEAVQTLASRGRYARMLTDALAAGSVPRQDVPPHLARQVRRVVGTRFADVWGPIPDDAVEDRAYSRYKGLVNDTAMKSANAQNGHSVFMRTCGPCHKMYGEGGVVGPDLTGSNRANFEYLLANVLNPNADVPEAYRMVLVTTRDGRTFSGNVVGETDRQLTLRVVGRDNAIITKSDIQSREATTVSMMPTGLFDSLTDHEVLDLVAFLRTTGPQAK